MLDFIASGFWQAIIFMVIVGVLFNILTRILRFIFRDSDFENTPFIRKLLYNIFMWGSMSASFFIVWHIRQGVGWLVFGIIGIVLFAGSFLGNVVSKQRNGG